MPGSTSSATTSNPSCASRTAKSPAPQPTSRTRRQPAGSDRFTNSEVWITSNCGAVVAAARSASLMPAPLRYRHLSLPPGGIHCDAWMPTAGGGDSRLHREVGERLFDDDRLAQVGQLMPARRHVDDGDGLSCADLAHRSDSVAGLQM